ncbi:hypothetical protein CVT26_013060 [Gymnopilus dilepis]|uniref:Uncharacterized protein n=1 Tax=Gymnopilus dilepis TaxID=231916 RepID=A0A409Y4C0_9AGAR|nr:hypothetical protein CVT26_013060 [Gymnopilus dilepis]
MSQTPNCDRETCNGTYSSLFRRWMEARGTEVVNTPIGYGFSGNLVSATMNIDSIDRDATCCERIRDAAKTFTLSRQWPQPTEIEIGPRYVWEKFLYFIGVDNAEPVEGCSDEGSDRSSSEHVKDTTMWPLDADVRLKEFVRDPYTNIAIFLSSYARTTGLIWADDNLECMAIILDFYVRYLLFHNIVPCMEDSLRRSLPLLEAAKSELPATSFIAKMLPDSLSRGCSDCWRWEDHLIPLSFVGAPPSTPVEGHPASSHAEEQSAMSQAYWDHVLYSASNQEDLPTPGTRTNDCTSLRSRPNADKTPWIPAKREQLCSLLSFVNLSLTHTTGIVERSLRRIKSIKCPQRWSPPAIRPTDDRASAAAVERAILLNKARLVLEPTSTGWDGGLIAICSEPNILAAPKHILSQEHDPLKTEIILLIDWDASTLASLKVGMGLGGTYVQVLRKDSAALGDRDNEKSDVASAFWYLDNLTAIIPSFWSVRK